MIEVVLFSGLDSFPSITKMDRLGIELVLEKKIRDQFGPHEISFEWGVADFAQEVDLLLNITLFDVDVSRTVARNSISVFEQWWAQVAQDERIDIETIAVGVRVIGPS